MSPVFDWHRFIDVSIVKVATKIGTVAYPVFVQSEGWKIFDHMNDADLITGDIVPFGDHYWLVLNNDGKFITKMDFWISPTGTKNGSRDKYKNGGSWGAVARNIP